VRALEFAILVAAMAFTASIAAAATLPKNIRTWAHPLVKGDSANFMKSVSRDVEVTHNIKGKPAKSDLAKLVSTFKGCSVSEFENKAYYVANGQSVSFACGGQFGSPHVIEFKMNAKKLIRLHFYVNAPCPTPDCS
jgi:hypothetical protein